MQAAQQRFGIYLIGQRAGGEPIRLDRSAGETVLLAFDTTRKRLVELHVINQGLPLDAGPRQSAMDRIEQTADLRGLSFMRVLGHGDEDGAIYYSANLNDGEPVADYIERRGALASVTTFALMQAYLDDLVGARKQHRLLSSMNVGTPLVTTHEDAFLQLRITDFGLNQAEPVDEEAPERRLVIDCCKLLFLLLTGQPHEGQSPDRLPVLTSLPTNLRTTLRTALIDPEHSCPSLERLRDDIREAYANQVPNLQMRSARRHLMLNDALHPRSHVQHLLLDTAPLADLLKGRYEPVNADDPGHQPFAIPATQLSNQHPVTVHVLPPSRIADKDQYDAVPLQMWRFNSTSHPNILRSLSLWETPDWTFLTEEREPGFPLSRLLAERSTLNPAEVALILRQVKAGLDQAKECGVMKADIHPSNITLRVGKEGVLQGREQERLMQKRMDAWPPFTVKIRTHATMRSLYEPQLVEPLEDQAGPESFVHEKDFRNRSFVALAIYLLTGQRNANGGAPEFGEAVPEPLAAFLTSTFELGRQLGATPPVGDFLDEFEKQMSAPVVEPRGLASFASNTVPVEEMESAGSVSDFAEDWTEDAPEPVAAAPTTYLSERPSLRPNPLRSHSPVFTPKSRKSNSALGMTIWAAGAVLVLLLTWLTFFRGRSADANILADMPTQSVLTPLSGEPPAPADAKPAPRGPEIIKKAIVPPVWEVEQMRSGQNASPSTPELDDTSAKTRRMVDAAASN